MPKLATHPVALDIDPGQSWMAALLGVPMTTHEVEVLLDGEVVRLGAEELSNEAGESQWGLPHHVNAETVAAWRSDPEHFTTGKLVVTFVESDIVKETTLILGTEADLRETLNGSDDEPETVAQRAEATFTVYLPDGTTQNRTYHP